MRVLFALIASLLVANYTIAQDKTDKYVPYPYDVINYAHYLTTYQKAPFPVNVVAYVKFTQREYLPKLSVLEKKEAVAFEIDIIKLDGNKKDKIPSLYETI